MSASSSRPPVDTQDQTKAGVLPKVVSVIPTIFFTISIYVFAKIVSFILLGVYSLLPFVVVVAKENGNLLQFVTTALIYVSCIAFLYVLVKKLRVSRAILGLCKPKLKDLLYVLAGFGIYFPVSILVGRIGPKLLPSLDFQAKQDIGYENAAGGVLILVFISLAILPPILEELVCRGFLYGNLRKKIPRYAAVMITSLLFAWPHLYGGQAGTILWIAGIDTFILSLILIYIREESDGIWACIGLHALKNTVAFLSIFVFKLA